MIEENYFNDLMSIYPNPSKGEIHIDIEDVIIDGAEVCIYDSMGSIIMQHKLECKQMNVDLPKGLYFLTLRKSGIAYTKKLIIQE